MDRTLLALFAILFIILGGIMLSTYKEPEPPAARVIIYGWENNSSFQVWVKVSAISVDGTVIPLEYTDTPIDPALLMDPTLLQFKNVTYVDVPNRTVYYDDGTKDELLFYDNFSGAENARWSVA